VRNLQRTPPATRFLSIAVTVIGAGLMIFALAADALGIGGGKGFGYQQMIVLIVGLVCLLGGASMLIQPLVNSKLRD